MKFYRISVDVATEEELTAEAVVNLKNVGPKVDSMGVALASAVLEIGIDKLYFVEAVVGEIKFDEKPDEEEIPATPVID